MLTEEGVSPSSILLLNFTRKASQEMLQRAARLLDSRCKKVVGGTFHSFGNLILLDLFLTDMALEPPNTSREGFSLPESSIEDRLILYLSETSLQ